MTTLLYYVILRTTKYLPFGVHDSTLFGIAWRDVLQFLFCILFSCSNLCYAILCTMHLLCKMTLQKRYFQLHWIQISLLKDFIHFSENISTKGRIRKKKRITSHTSKKKVTIISFYLKCTWGQIAFTSSYKWTHKDVLWHFDRILQDFFYFSHDNLKYIR